jgi:hypothetical protein
MLKKVRAFLEWGRCSANAVERGIQMAVTKEELRLSFRAEDMPFGVTRQMLKAMAVKLDMSETQVIHRALAKLASEVLSSYAPDDGPLTARQIKALRHDAASHLPKGMVLSTETLFR